MKNLQKLAIFGISLAFVLACKSSKNNLTKEQLIKKKDLVAVESATKIGNMFDKLANDLQSSMQKNVEILRTAEGVNITFEPNISFDSNSEQLTENGKMNLGKAAYILAKYPFTEVFVEGHADSSGNQLKNKKLSELRAKTVAIFLKNQGVKTERLAISGYGATKPIASNATPEGRKRNRRVIVKIRANEQRFFSVNNLSNAKQNHK